MSKISINSTLPSLNAQRRLRLASDLLASSFEKLSSGLRINRASDDAAGLAVASTLKADCRIYSQAVRNLNDGASALSIADSAIKTLSSIVIRMQELATQSASGTFSSRQRISMDAEAQALACEYLRIAQTTDFNGMKLFDGSVQGLSLQAGYGTAGSIGSSLGGTMGTGTFQTAISYVTIGGSGTAQSRAVAVADLNGDGIQDVATAGEDGVTGGYVAITLGNGDGTFRSASLLGGEGANFLHAVSLSDINSDGIFDVVTSGAGVGAGCAYTFLGNGDGTFSASRSYRTAGGTASAVTLSDVNGDNVLDLLTAGYNQTFTQGHATVHLGNGDGTFAAFQSYSTESSLSKAISASDVNNDGILDLLTSGDGGSGYVTIRLGVGDGTFKASLSYEAESDISWALSVSDLNGDGNLDVVSAGSGTGGGLATVRLGNGNGTFRAAFSYQMENGAGGLTGSHAVAIGDVNGDGLSDLVTAGVVGNGPLQGYSTIRLGKGDGTFRAALSYRSDAGSHGSNAVALADVNGDGVVDLLTGGGGGSACMTLRLADTRDGVSPILPFSLKSRADACQALPVLQQTLDRLTLQRGHLGAFQSRVTSALSTLGSASRESAGTQSRIEDLDIAEESGRLLRQQILQQAATSVLAQANQVPQLALRLLGR